MNDAHFHDGAPANLEAAALDAAEWLAVFLRHNGTLTLTPEAVAILQRCTQALEQQLAGVTATYTHSDPNDAA